MFLRQSAKGKLLIIARVNSLVILCGLLSFLAYFAYRGQIGIDKRFMTWYQGSFDSNVWIKAMEVVSFPGNGYNWLVAMTIVFAICITLKKGAAAMLVLSSGGVYLLNFLLKDLIHRVRPLATEVNVIGEAESDYGFPSGHVTSYIALFGVVFLLSAIYVKITWLRLFLQVLSILLILLVGLSRMTLGMHWPTDVIAGYLLGLIFLLVAVPAFFRFRAKELQR